VLDAAALTCSLSVTLVKPTSSFVVACARNEAKVPSSSKLSPLKANSFPVKVKPEPAV
jgi:hypothetical protein